MAAQPHLHHAADLYTGDFLAGFYADWALVEQERLREIHLQILERLIGAQKAVDAYDAALRAALSLIAADPLRETAYQEAMRLTLHLGRPHEARRLFDQCRATLQAELGVDPEPETAAILAQPGPTASAAGSEALALSGVHNDLSDHAGVKAAGKRAIALYRQTQNPVGEADVLATLGAVSMEQGRLDEADGYFGQALPVLRASGYRYAEARCLVNWGSVDYLRGRLGDGLARFRLGAQIFREVGSERGLHFTHLNIAATLSTTWGWITRRRP